MATLLITRLTGILLLALGLDWALRKRAALACSAIWNATLIALACVPIAAFIFPSVPLEWLPAEVQHESAGTMITSLPEQTSIGLAQRATAMRDGQVDFDESALERATQETWSLSATQLVAWLYAIGVCACLARLAIAFAALARLRSTSTPVECSHWLSRLDYWRSALRCRFVDLRGSSAVDVPLLFGLSRPTILIPESMLRDLNGQQIDAILVHELAHAIRRDFDWLAFGRVVQALLWFHPLMWLADRRIQFIRERACDDFAAYRLGGGTAYGEALLEIASRVTRRPALGLALAMFRRPQIAARIEAIAQAAGCSRCRLSLPARLAVMLICLSLATAVGALRLVAAHRSEQAPAKAEASSPSTAEKATPSRTMVVQVLGPDDQPLLGAKIHVGLWTKEPFAANRDFKTDAEGRVKFDLPMQIEILRLWATYQGHVGLFAQWWPEKEQNPREIPTEYTYRLAKGTTIGGAVKNADGQTITGARVQVQLVGPLGQAQQRELDVRAIPNSWLAYGSDAKVTDAAGRWSLDNVPAGDNVEVQLMVTHPDYESQSKWGDQQKAQGVTMAALREQTAAIVLSRGASVSGHVTSTDGRPVADAIIVWGHDPYLERGSQEVRSDSSGAYRLPPQPAGPLTLTVVAEGWAPDQREINHTSGASIADFALQPGKTTQIRFVDEAGAPIPNVVVAIGSWRGNKALYNYVHPNVLNSKIPTEANAEGVYEWTWSPGDDVSYIFAKQGYPKLNGIPTAAFTFRSGEHVVTASKGN